MKLLKLIHEFVLSNGDLEELERLDLKDLKQLTLKILDFLDLEGLKQFFFNVENINLEEFKKIFLERLNNFNLESKEFEDKRLEFIFHKIKIFSEIAQTLSNFYNLFLINRKNVVSLIFKINKKTKPSFIEWCLDKIDNFKVDEKTELFLTFIEWCLSKSDLSEEEIRCVKDFYVKSSRSRKWKVMKRRVIYYGIIAINGGIIGYIIYCSLTNSNLKFL